MQTNINKTNDVQTISNDVQIDVNDIQTNETNTKKTDTKIDKRLQNENLDDGCNCCSNCCYCSCVNGNQVVVLILVIIGTALLISSFVLFAEAENRVELHNSAIGTLAGGLGSYVLALLYCGLAGGCNIEGMGDCGDDD